MGTGAGEAATPRRGWVAPAVAAELPGLGLSWLEVDGSPSGRSPAPVRERLRLLSDRFYGSHAVHMRERPIPWAYRVFFRQIGLDPDRERTPVEALALARLHDGAFKSHGLPADALAIATIETGVALRAFDRAAVVGEPGIRQTAPGESLPGAATPLDAGTLVLADEARPLGPLFGPGAEVVADGEGGYVLIAITVSGVPAIAVDEALGIAASVI